MSGPHLYPRTVVPFLDSFLSPCLYPSSQGVSPLRAVLVWFGGPSPGMPPTTACVPNDGVKSRLRMWPLDEKSGGMGSSGHLSGSVFLTHPSPDVEFLWVCQESAFLTKHTPRCFWCKFEVLPAIGSKPCILQNRKVRSRDSQWLQQDSVPTPTLPCLSHSLSLTHTHSFCELK